MLCNAEDVPRCTPAANHKRRLALAIETLCAAFKEAVAYAKGTAMTPIKKSHRRLLEASDSLGVVSN